MGNTDSARRGGVTREMTLATIREPPAADYVEVLFLESARIYHLARSHPKFHDILNVLRATSAGTTRVEVHLASANSDVITNVRLP